MFAVDVDVDIVVAVVVVFAAGLYVQVVAVANIVRTYPQSSLLLAAPIIKQEKKRERVFFVRNLFSLLVPKKDDVRPMPLSGGCWKERYEYW